MSEQQISTRVLTIPNVLTFVRMGLIPVFATLLVYGRETGALIVFSPWLMLLLVAAVVPAFLGETHFAVLSYSMLYRQTPQRREALDPIDPRLRSQHAALSTHHDMLH